MVVTSDRLEDWIGRTETVVDDLSPWPARAVSAMLDDALPRSGVSAALPPLWQWFYFLGTTSQSHLSADGHPERGGFLPPVPLPRRMFAGARMRFHHPLTLGEPATREAVIRNVSCKTGSTGALTFVTVGYEFHQSGRLCIEEEQDIVYRDAGAALAAPVPVKPGPVSDDTWWRDIEPDPRLLFRFSALTFNAHRIHYDRSYAMSEEGYPGLVVHGPLTAVMLAQLVHANTDRSIVAFDFRGKAPLFDLAPFRLIGRAESDQVALEVRGADGRVTQSANVQLAKANAHRR